ncbi:MAG: 3-isopropylmalate dehydrogenase [Verrucomicrobiia bacterium]
MKTYSIAVLPGDGTGPEVVREGIKVAEVAAKKFGFKLDWHFYDFGGERYLKTGEVLPDSAIEEFRRYKTIFLGAVGHPKVKPGILEKGLLLRLRFELEQYINLRPVKLFRAADCPLKDKGPEHVDFVVVRENCEGIYTGTGGSVFKGTPHEVAIQDSVNTRRGVDRCLKYAFDLAAKRHVGKPWKGLKPEDVAAGKTAQLMLCGKTNVLTYAFDLWERAFHEMGAGYPTVKRDYAHVDATCMWFVKNPEWFDVIVTDNMFGDIITDLAAIIQGGLGVAAGGNINPNGCSMFEPMGGSAPKYTNQNVINPLAAINAGALLLDFLGEGVAAKAIENSVIQVVNTKLKSLAAGRMGYTTTEVGDLVAQLIA